MFRCSVCKKIIFNGTICEKCKKDQEELETMMKEAEKVREQRKVAFAHTSMGAIQDAVQNTQNLADALLMLIMAGRQCMEGNCHIEMSEEQYKLFNRCVGLYDVPCQKVRSGVNPTMYVYDFSDPVVYGHLFMAVSLISIQLAAYSCTNISQAYNKAYEFIYGGNKKAEPVAREMSKAAEDMRWQFFEKYKSVALREYFDMTHVFGYPASIANQLERLEPRPR